MFHEVLNAKNVRVAIALITIPLLVCPGFLFLYVFARASFASFDVLRVLALALSVSAPIFAVNLLGGAAMTLFALPGRRPDGEKHEDDIYGSCLVSAAVFSVPPLYLPVLARLFYPLGIRGAVVTATLTELGIVAVMVGLTVLVWWHGPQPVPDRPRAAGEP
jgi:hypothetical protein